MGDSAGTQIPSVLYLLMWQQCEAVILVPTCIFFIKKVFIQHFSQKKCIYPSLISPNLLFAEMSEICQTQQDKEPSTKMKVFILSGKEKWQRPGKPTETCLVDFLL